MNTIIVKLVLPHVLLKLTLIRKRLSTSILAKVLWSMFSTKEGSPPITAIYMQPCVKGDGWLEDSHEL